MGLMKKRKKREKWKKRRKGMENLKVISPWMEYYKQVEALFKKDPAVKVVYDDDSKTLYMYVKGEAKADAIRFLMPEGAEFGNVKLTVKVIPFNEEKTVEDILRDAFDGNDAKAYIYTSPGPVLEGLSYVVFKPEVAQYFADNLQDINGNRSSLYQDLASGVFKDIPGITYCTDALSYELRKPLGEWP